MTLRPATARKRPRSSTAVGKCAPTSFASWRSPRAHAGRTPTPSRLRRTTPRKRRCPPSGGATMNLFSNTVTLRGFLGSNAEAPSSDHIKQDSFAVLLLATVSGVWGLSTNQWTPRTDWHRVTCPGPFFCGMVRGMRRGDYLEIEGELRVQQQERSVVVAGERFPMKLGSYAVHATRITRLDRPDALVDLGEDG